MPIKGITETGRCYAIEVEKDALLKILKYERDWLNNDYLVDHLDSLPGVSEINYSGHFGPYIYLMITKDYDNEETWKKIKDMITASISPS